MNFNNIAARLGVFLVPLFFFNLFPLFSAFAAKNGISSEFSISINPFSCVFQTNKVSSNPFIYALCIDRKTYQLVKIKDKYTLPCETSVSAEYYENLVRTAKSLEGKKITLILSSSRCSGETIVGLIDNGRYIYPENLVSDADIALIKKTAFENSTEGIEKKKQSLELNAKQYSFDVSQKCCINDSFAPLVAESLKSEGELPERDEFETSEEYSSRINMVKVGTTIKATQPLLFKLSSNVGWARYDADSKTMTFGITESEKDRHSSGLPHDCNGSFIQKNNLGFIISLHENKIMSDYVGENVFGVTRNVEKSSEISYYANILNRDELEPLFTLNSSGQLKVGEIAIDTEYAKLIKQNYAVYIMVMPIKHNNLAPKTEDKNNKFTLYTCSHFKPHTGWLFDKQYHKTFINSNLLAILVVDTSTGKTLKALDFGNNKKLIEEFLLHD